MKKTYITILSIIAILLIQINIFAETFSISAGIPVSHVVNTTDLDFEVESVTGGLVHLKLPIMLGFGVESYVTKVEDFSTYENATITTNGLW